MQSKLNKTTHPNILSKNVALVYWGFPLLLRITFNGMVT